MSGVADGVPSMATFDYVPDSLEPGLRRYDAKKLSDALAIDTTLEPTLVQQQFADEVDVNTIVRRFGITREMPFGTAEGVYADFSGVTDYQSALDKISDARERFMGLPPDVRERFNNDPGELIEFAQRVSPEEFDAAFAPVEPDPPVNT